MEVYKHKKFFIAVDCIIFGFDDTGLKILLIKRNFQPHQGEWSLMGGFLKEDETPDESAQRVLKDLTGLNNIYLEQLYTYGDIHRDDAARVISISYYALVNTTVFDESCCGDYDARWFDVQKIPELIFDHNQMVNKALKRLKRRSRSQPIGFELLPEKFTIPQLQHLYEAIWQEKLDKRNFRRKILSSDLLDKLEEKEKENSRRGAYLYRFDTKKYEELSSKGYHFEI